MKYFTIKELTKSDTAELNCIENLPSPEEISNLEKLINNVLDPLREAYGKPIYVNSGYRSFKLNRIVGGSSTSEHMRGMAADITTGTHEGNKRLFELSKELNLPVRQCIDEYDYRWIHVSYNEKDIKRQYLHLGGKK